MSIGYQTGPKLTYRAGIPVRIPQNADLAASPYSRLGYDFYVIYLPIFCLPGRAPF